MKGKKGKNGSKGKGGNKRAPSRRPPPEVIPFPSREGSLERFALRRGRKPPGDFDVVIHQEELEEERILARRAHEALTALRELREGLLWRYLEYGIVEPGARSLEALKVRSEPKQTKGSSFYRLKVT